MTTNFRPVDYDPLLDAPRFNVAPRYTCGSPALVRRALALRIARQEREQYEAVIDGILGETKKAQATELGLGGIVEERWEMRGRRCFRDLLTGDIGFYNDKGGKEVVGKIAVET